jgi:hypothetical protein
MLEAIIALKEANNKLSSHIVLSGRPECIVSPVLFLMVRGTMRTMAMD